MPRSDHLAHQHCARGPFPAETKTHQRAGRQKLAVALRQPTEAGEESEPEDGDLERPYAADPIGDESGQPAAEGGSEERGRLQRSRLRLGEVPASDQRRDDEAVELEVHAIERPAAEAGAERRALALGHLAPERHAHRLEQISS